MASRGPKRRVFVLGAGFSYAAGIPLAPQLTDLLLAKLPLREDDRRLVDLLRTQLGDGASPEQLADATRQLAQLATLWARAYSPSGSIIEGTSGESRPATPEEHRQAVERCRSERESEASRLGSSIPTALERALPQALLDCHPDKTPEYMDRFVSALKPTDVIITFNYDVLVERALQDAGVLPDLGFSAKPSESLRLLKLHGSVDWFALNMRGQIRSELQVLYDSRQESHEDDPKTWKLVREPRKEQLQDAIQSTRYDVGDVAQGGFFKLAFPGFGVFKRVEEVPGLWFVWRSAWDAIGDADEVYVVGYSLPPTDSLVRLAFGLFFGSRDSPPEKLIIVNPVGTLDVDDFGRVFRSRVTHMRLRAEDVDWRHL